MVILVLRKSLMTIIIVFKRGFIILLITSIWSNIMIILKKSKSVIIMGDSVLKTIKSRGLSKCKKVSVCNFPGATSKGILNEIGNPP